MTEFDADDAALPGLESPEHGDRLLPVRGEVEKAARRSIAGLAEQLTEADAVMCQALLTCARQLDRAVNSKHSKDYGVANLLAQLRETFTILRGDADGGEEGDAFDRLARELGRAAAVRDGTEPAPAE